MIIVKLFAILKDKAGRDELRIEAGPGTVSELLTVVSNQYPILSDMISGNRLLISVNREFAKADSRVKDNDEVALMPPFSGGTS
jgi:MoaD family protein